MSTYLTGDWGSLNKEGRFLVRYHGISPLTMGFKLWRAGSRSRPSEKCFSDDRVVVIFVSDFWPPRFSLAAMLYFQEFFLPSMDFVLLPGSRQRMAGFLQFFRYFSYLLQKTLFLNMNSTFLSVYLSYPSFVVLLFPCEFQSMLVLIRRYKPEWNWQLS